MEHKITRKEKKDNATRIKKGREPLTKDIADQIDNEIKRTKMSVERYINNYGKTENFCARTVQRWRSQDAKTICTAAKAEFFAIWSKLPDGLGEKMPYRTTVGYVLIDKSIIDQINAETERVGITISTLFDTSDNIPEGLSSATVYNWLSGRVASAKKEYIEFVISELQSLPTTDMVEVSDKLVETMKTEIERTGKGAAALSLSLKRSESYELDSKKITGWVSGKLKNAKRGQIEAAINHWKSLPNYDEVWIVISGKQRLELRELMSKAEISTPEFFRVNKDIPAKFTVNLLHAVLSGNYKKLRRLHFEYLNSKLTELISARASNPGTRTKTIKSVDHIAFTGELRVNLLNEIDRTGIGITAFIRINGGRRSLKHIGTAQLTSWLRGNRKYVKADDYYAVLEAWREQPDKNSYWD